MENVFQQMLDINVSVILVSTEPLKFSKLTKCNKDESQFEFLGFIGNGSHCEEPVRHESGFLLLSQGVATVKLPFDGKRGTPISMANVS